MKIGITCYPTYGGSGAVATELGIALAGQGHEVHFITYQQPFRLPSFLPNVYFHEVDVVRYPLFEYPPYDLALAVRMHEVVREHRLDLIHAHYAIPHATSAWIAREMLVENGAGVRIITTLHGTDITLVGQDPSYHPITKFSIERSDGLTAVSEFLRRETFNAFGCTGCAVEVIHNFVDPAVYSRERYRPVLKERFGRDRAVLLHVSNFRKVKRVRDAVRVYAKVRERVPSVLVMVGDGPERVDAEQEARALGVDDVDRVFRTDDLVGGDVAVVATGVSNGDLLRGVRFYADSARTHSLVMCTRCNWVRFVDGIHFFARERREEVRLLGW
jgi:N-acetyl-alpha-D-glucosaminyl L-malate synthase BshA